MKNFLGFDYSFKEADIIYFGTPYDCTASYRAGARFGPSAVRGESFAIETYSPYQDRDLGEIKVHDAGDLELGYGSPVLPLKTIEKFVTRVAVANKLPFMVGGEHLVTLGAVKALYKKYLDLKVIHFDAHTDLREQYLGEKLSHASVIKRVWEILGDNSIAQFGIRSGEREEFEWAKEHTHLQKFNFDGLDKALDKFGNSPIYLSIDLDILDPSVLPGTGTPEAGGVSFLGLLNASLKVTAKNIVGIDVVELVPTLDTSGISTVTACKLIRELALSLKTKELK